MNYELQLLIFFISSYFERVLKIIFIVFTSLLFMAKVTYKLRLYKFYGLFSPLLPAPTVPPCH